MPPRWNQNRLTAKLGIDYPIIQGPLGGLSSQRLTAAVSNFGGLGSFGAHSLPPDAIKDVIAEIRSLTVETVRDELVGVDGRRRCSNSRMKTRSTGAWLHWSHISPPWERLVQRTNHIRRTRFEDQARVLTRREGTGIQLHLRNSTKRNLGGVSGERHRHHWHGDHTR